MKHATDHLMQADPVMAAIIRKVGPCLLTPREPTFETLARSITFQQLSGKAAATIFERLRKSVGRRFTATAFLKLSEEDLRACGLSRQKIASLTDLAQHIAARKINFKKLPQLDDAEIIQLLCQVRGIGVWTVQMFLMFALQRPNILPTSDLGIRNAIWKAYNLEAAPKPADIETLARHWHPHCTIACWYLWRSLDGPATL